MLRFSGNFLFGRHSDYDGGIAGKVRTALNDLIIGALVSRDCVNTGYGRKVEKATPCRQKVCSSFIVGED